MRKTVEVTMIALAGTLLLAGAASAQNAAQGDQACGTPPCATSAPGGTTGTGPVQLRTEPTQSPVGTGAGSSGSGSSASTGGAGGAGATKGSGGAGAGTSK